MQYVSFTLLQSRWSLLRSSTAAIEFHVAVYTFASRHFVTYRRMQAAALCCCCCYFKKPTSEPDVIALLARLQQLWLHLLISPPYLFLTAYQTTDTLRLVLLLSSSSPTTRKWSSEFEVIINTISQRCIHSIRQSLLTTSNTSQIHIPTVLSGLKRFIQ